MIIVENDQKQFDFSKTPKEKEASVNCVNAHDVELRKFYGEEIYRHYKRKIFNINPVLRDELIEKYKKIKRSNARKSGKLVLKINKTL